MIFSLVRGCIRLIELFPVGAVVGGFDQDPGAACFGVDEEGVGGSDASHVDLVGGFGVGFGVFGVDSHFFPREATSAG